MGVEPASVCPSVHPCMNTLNMNISATSEPIVTRFCMKHHWDGGKAVKCFWTDRIGIPVSMATDSSHRFIMEKISLAL